MPESSSSDIPHVTINDHKIAVHNKRVKVDKGDFIGLVALNNQKPDNLTKAKAYIQHYEKISSDEFLLDSANNYLSKLSLDVSFQVSIHLYFLKKDYESIRNIVYAVENYPLNKMTYDNQHAWTLYRIGYSFANNKQNILAIEYYERAVALAPYVLEFKMKLADLLLNQGSYEKSIIHYKNILNEFPKMQTAWCNLGFAYLKYGNIIEAEVCFNNSISLDPNHIQTLLNLASIHVLLDEKEKVVKYLKRVLDIQPNNIKANNLLKEINV